MIEQEIQLKTLLKRLMIGTLAATILLAVAAWVTLTWIITRPATYQPGVELGPVVLRSWPEHDSIYRETKFPYVLSANCDQ